MRFPLSSAGYGTDYISVSFSVPNLRFSNKTKHTNRGIMKYLLTESEVGHGGEIFGSRPWRTDRAETEISCAP